MSVKQELLCKLWHLTKPTCRSPHCLGKPSVVTLRFHIHFTSQPEWSHLAYDSVKAISANGLKHFDEASHPPFPKSLFDWTAVELPPVRHRTAISWFTALPSPHTTIWLAMCWNVYCEISPPWAGNLGCSIRAALSLLCTARAAVPV